MAHPAQRRFLRAAAQALPGHFRSPNRVLEIGSLDINGSARDFVTGPEIYVGIDLGTGKGVDVVASGADFAAPSKSFDLILSCECLEHNPYWKQTLINANRMLTDDGLLCLSFATIGRPEHGTSRSEPADSPHTVGMGWDYYANLRAREVTRLLRSMQLSTWHATDRVAFDAYILASRNPELLKRVARDLKVFTRQTRRRNLTPLAIVDTVMLHACGASALNELPRTLIRARTLLTRLLGRAGLLPSDFIRVT